MLFLYNFVLFCTILYNVQFCTILCCFCTILYNFVQCTILYNFIQFYVVCVQLYVVFVQLNVVFVQQKGGGPKVVLTSI